MIHFFEHRGTKVKIWINELPNTFTESSEYLEYSCCTYCDKKFDTNKAAVELYLRRHNSNYGLLGVEFIPNNTKTLCIQVYYCNENNNSYNETIAYNKETVFISLPQEYAEAILTKSQEYAKLNIFPSGTLIFRVGAHCEIGSSKALFKIMTEFLISILIMNKKQYEEKEIQKLLDRLLVF